MQKPFEDASFGLGVGQISGVVETDSGVHISMFHFLNPHLTVDVLFYSSSTGLSQLCQ